MRTLSSVGAGREVLVGGWSGVLRSRIWDVRKWDLVVVTVREGSEGVGGIFGGKAWLVLLLELSSGDGDGEGATDAMAYCQGRQGGRI